ncbi:cyclophilin-like fold protein [Kribbella lupini]
MRDFRRTAVAVVALAIGSTLVACGADATPGDTARVATPTSSDTARPTTPTSSEENGMRLRITIGDEHFQATLDESAASRDLAALLPLTVRMSDHGGVEKTGRLPSPLSLDGQPAGADPAVGDVGYYAPGNDLVLYYGDQSYYDGIVVLGRLRDDAAERIAAMDGSITVQLQR